MKRSTSPSAPVTARAAMDRMHSRNTAPAVLTRPSRSERLPHTKRPAMLQAENTLTKRAARAGA